MATTVTTIEVIRTADYGTAVYLRVDGKDHYVRMDVLRDAAGPTNAEDLRAIYATVYERAKELVERERGERSWYALVTFGAPSWSGTDERFLAGGLTGQGLTARARLIRLASEAKGTGSCTDARVIRCDDQESAMQADISTSADVAYSA